MFPNSKKSIRGYRLAKLFILMLLALFTFPLKGQHESRASFTKGVYGDPAAFLKNGMSFKSLGINALFVRSASLTPDLYKAAREDGIRVYVEFPTLNGKDYLADHPEAWPINEKGERAPAADW